MFTAIRILISYLIAMVVAGHGAIPMGLLLIIPLVMGKSDSWAVLPIISGWKGIIGLISATFLFRSVPVKQMTYQFLASLILYLSWLLIAIIGNDESGSLLSSFILSAPFQITFFSVAKRFMFQLETNTDSTKMS